MRRFISSISGATAVEFAMLLPVYLTVLFGIVVFGSYLAAIHGVQQLAAESARVSVSGMTETERSTLAKNYVAANAATYPLIDPTKLTVTAATPSGSTTTFVVTVNYNVAGMFIYSLPFVPTPASTIVRSAVIPYGGF